MLWFFVLGCQTGSSEGLSGQQLYKRSCINCHKSHGKGIQNVYPPLAGSDWVTTEDPSIPVRIVLHGLKGEIVVNNIRYDSAMVGWGETLNDEQIANIVTYIRTSWGNEGSAVSADEVKVIRDKYPNHSQWTVKQLKSQ